VNWIKGWQGTGTKVGSELDQRLAVNWIKGWQGTGTKVGRELDEGWQRTE
jgi:hypothetical protein